MSLRAWYVGLLLCVGCASDPGAQESGPASESGPVGAQGPLAIHAGEEGVGDAAMLVGTLMLEDGCLYVREEAPTLEPRRVLPVFPRTVRWDEARQVVILGKHEVPIGAGVTLGGGELHPASNVIEVAPDTCDSSVGFVANTMELGKRQ